MVLLKEYYYDKGKRSQNFSRDTEVGCENEAHFQSYLIDYSCVCTPVERIRLDITQTSNARAGTVNKKAFWKVFIFIT